MKGTFMKNHILITLMMMTTPALADSFRTVKVAHETKRYSYSAEYPELLPGSVPAFQRINEQLLKDVVNNGCELDEGSKQMQYNYNVVVKIVALNPKYVGVRVQSDDYCGGAHPNNSTYFLTYASANGKPLAIEREFGFEDSSRPDFDFEKDQARRLLLAERMVTKLNKADFDSECYSGTNKEIAEQIASFWPSVSGLANNRRVILSISPPHVATVCYFDAVFSYDEVKDLINDGSYLHRWLR